MKRILSLTLSLLMLMSMATIVGATTDSNVVWQEDFNDGVTIGEARGANPMYVDLDGGDVMYFVEKDGNRQIGAASTAITVPEGAYGKGSHEKSLFIEMGGYSDDHVRAFFAANFPQELPISDDQMGHIGFDWISFATGGRDAGRRDIYLNVKFLNANQEEVTEQVQIGTLTDRRFTAVGATANNGELANWNRLSAYVKGGTVYVAGFYGDTWHSINMITTARTGYTPLAVTGLEIGVGYNNGSKPSHLYGLDNFIAEKVDAVPTVGSTNTEGRVPIFVPFVDVSSSRILRNRQGETMSKQITMSFLSDHPSGALPEGTTAAVHSRSFLTYDTTNFTNYNHLSDHEAIIENVAGYYITDATDRAAVMGSSAYTMTDGFDFGLISSIAAGDKIHYSYKFKYTGAEHSSNHILMELISEASGVVSTLMRMKSDGTLINAAGDALTKLVENTYYNVEILYTQGDINTYTTADVYVNGKKIDSVNMYKYDITRIQKMAVTFYGEPKGEAEEVTFGDVTTSAVEYYAHSLHVDDVYINHARVHGAFNKTPYVAYDLNKSLSEAADNIAKYGIVLDPGSMTASRVSNDWTAASFLAAINLPNVSVVDAEGTALTGEEFLVGNRIKITGEFGAPVYYTATAAGANVADTDFVLAATQNGALVTTTCAAGTALTVKAVDDAYATPQIFVAEYQTVGEALDLVSCKGGAGAASLTPSVAGNIVKVFVLSTSDGLQPLYETVFEFTVQ